MVSVLYNSYDVDLFVLPSNFYAPFAKCYAPSFLFDNVAVTHWWFLNVKKSYVSLETYLKNYSSELVPTKFSYSAKCHRNPLAITTFSFCSR